MTGQGGGGSVGLPSDWVNMSGALYSMSDTPLANNLCHSSFCWPVHILIDEIVESQLCSGNGV